MLSTASPAGAADAVLYELTEAVKIEDAAGRFKSSQATLAGTIAAGTPLCPRSLVAQVRASNCSLTVRAVGKADDATGTGPVTADIQVLVQDANQVDAPEVVVIKGRVHGTLDMSPAFLRQIPLGSITGRFTASGVPGSPAAGFSGSGAFNGVFRIPFEHNGRPSYLLDNGSIEPVRSHERALGIPTVRLEIDLRGR